MSRALATVPGDSHGHLTDRSDGSFQEACREIEQAMAVAEREGYQPPPTELVEFTRELLEKIYGDVSLPYEVAPEDDGGISIRAVREGMYVTLVLSPTGSDRCFVGKRGEMRRTIYSNRGNIFGPFLRGALRELDGVDLFSDGVYLSVVIEETEEEAWTYHLSNPGKDWVGASSPETTLVRRTRRSHTARFTGKTASQYQLTGATTQRIKSWPRWQGKTAGRENRPSSAGGD
ncbi:MAG: hypothetical protein F4107_12980 [Gemmatimonadetes bacterium]|nr:hypothetical protein [Gemmatimonadota bacterium]MYD14347.1 hypothetical protein [Gemmatimonadota bacterium]MYI66828.1 hypothetical protein [Gemmatimonadota bacterium]